MISLPEKSKEKIFLSDNPLLAFLIENFNINDDVREFIANNTFPRKLLRGKYLLKPGDICSHYYYIDKGILRAYIKFGKKEVTTWINTEEEIITSIRSMTIQEPAIEYIQAIEDCELVVMAYDKMEEMYQRFPEMNTVGRLLLQEYYADAEERAFLSRIPSADVRYRHFVESRPELQNRIAMKYVASYLGVTVETLSRLRSKKNL